MTAQRADELVFTEALPIGTPEERDLAVAFKRGEKDAYNDIHERYAPRVHSVCRRMLGNPDDAQEAAQEAFLRIYQGLPRFNGRYRLGAWVVRIATNVCLDQLRARSRRPSDPAPSEVLDYEISQPVEDADPELLFLRHAEGRRIGKVLNTLPPMHRAAIVLRDFEGVSYADIAETLGITEGQVKALLHRARRRFKRTWTTNVASLFLPFATFMRLFKRVEVEAEARTTGHLTSVSHAAESALTTGQQFAMTASQAANACSSVWTQCGQFVVDKAAPIATAVAVSAASVGAGVALSRSTDDQPTKPKVQAPIAESEPASARREGTAVPRDQAPATPDKPAKEAPVNEAPATDPVDEAPVPPVDDPVVVPPAGGPTTPAPEPSPSPSVPPPPVVPPWAFSAKSTMSSESLCACDAAPKLVHSEVRGKPGGRMNFVQRVNGAILDAEGDAAWAMSADYAGRIIGSQGSLNVTMLITTQFGTYKYQSIGRLVTKYQLPDGSYGYDFVGNYVLASQTGSSEGMPASGQLGSMFSVTADGEVYNASFSLQETSPTG